MSMIGNYMVVEEELIRQIQRGEITAEAIIYESEEIEGTRLDIDKAWHGIHYLLCGEPWEGELPLFNVVLGGTPVNDEDLGYGPARFLTAAEVMEAYEAIKDITMEQLKSRFDIKDMREKDIYPGFEHEDYFEYVYRNFEEVVCFFGRAADYGKGMLLYVN